jgi:hypothetical protein
MAMIPVVLVALQPRGYNDGISPAVPQTVHTALMRSENAMHPGMLETQRKSLVLPPLTTTRGVSLRRHYAC